MSRSLPRRGFTLVEVLVVLVLTSLLVTILMQSLTYVFSLRERVLAHVTDKAQIGLSERWYRQAVRSAIADLPELERRFEGDRAGFSVVTLAPLHLDYGIPTPVRWRINESSGRYLLRYEADSISFELLEWRETPGEFAYLDHAGEWQDQWPPRFGDESRQLPAAVLFQGRYRGEPVSWLASIPTRKRPRTGLRLPDEFL